MSRWREAAQRALAMLIPIAFGMLLALALAGPAAAREDAAEPKVQQQSLAEIRARSLMREFACMVCDGQSIADSDAEIAVRMRQVVLDAVADGRSDSEIRSFMAEHYGESVLLRPPAQGFGVALWLAPLAIVILGAAALVTVFRGADDTR